MTAWRWKHLRALQLPSCPSCIRQPQLAPACAAPPERALCSKAAVGASDVRAVGQGCTIQSQVGGSERDRKIVAYEMFLEWTRRQGHTWGAMPAPSCSLSTASSASSPASSTAVAASSDPLNCALAPTCQCVVAGFRAGCACATHLAASGSG